MQSKDLSERSREPRWKALFEWVRELVLYGYMKLAQCMDDVRVADVRIEQTTSVEVVWQRARAEEDGGYCG